jgi:hypothetical protein
MSKQTKLFYARKLMEASARERAEAIKMPGSDKRLQLLTVQLYNAASAYQIWQDSEGSGNWDYAQEFSNNLEAAADAYALR